MMNLNFEESDWSRRNPNYSGSEHGPRGESWQEPSGGDSSESTEQQRRRGRRRRPRNRRNESQEQEENGQSHDFQDPQPPFPQNQRDQGLHYNGPYGNAPQPCNQMFGQNFRHMMPPPYNQGQRPPYQPPPSPQPRPPYQPQQSRHPRPPYQPPHHQNYRSQNSQGSKQWSTPQNIDLLQYSEDEESNNGTISPPPSYEASNLQYGIGMYPTAPPLKDLDEKPYVPNSSPLYNSSQQPVVGDGEKWQLHMQDTRLNPEDLVKALACLKGQCDAADSISRCVQRTVKEVVAVARSRKDIFSCMNKNRRMIIELVPDVSLCTSYLSQKGCVSVDSCRDLHLCKFFAVGFCGSGISCQYGHQWDTGHNSSVLSKFHLDVIKKVDLHSVIKKVCKGSVLPQICQYYNRQQGCKKKERCGFFHICRDYLMGCGKCCIQNCSLNHDIFTEHCKRLMVRYGISMNETERDILINFKSSLENQDDGQSQSLSSGEKFKKSKGKNGKAEKFDDSYDEVDDDDKAASSDSDSDYSRKSDVAGRSRGQKKNRRGKKGYKDTGTTKKKVIPTCLATDICGDVKISEICLYAVKGKCVKQNCRYLHAKSPFHWQVEKDSKWYNFRVFHSKQLEKAYQDVSKDTVQLPPLYPNKLEPRAKELLNVLGTGSLTADFKDMTVEDFSTRNILKIRRISTKSAAVCDHPDSTVYEWYFIDKQNKWIRYGLADSLGNQKYVCSTTCEEIEKGYLKDPSLPMMISSTYFKYKLDFQQMTQTNLQTGMEREIRRRPKSSFTSDQVSFPSHWISVPPDEISIRVPVNNGGSEYLRISTLLRRSLPAVSIQKIERLQNPFLWRLLQYKKADLSRR